MADITPQAGRELARLPVTRIQDVLLARLVVREEASRLGFTPTSITQIATAVSEITRNVVQHSGAAGHVRISEARESGAVALCITVEDYGTGIPDIEATLLGASPGAGIPGSRKLMDELTIRSAPGAGTSVTMIKWLRAS